MFNKYVNVNAVFFLQSMANKCSNKQIAAVLA
jgi:hypothetical protein